MKWLLFLVSATALAAQPPAERAPLVPEASTAAEASPAVAASPAVEAAPAALPFAATTRLEVRHVLSVAYGVHRSGTFSSDSELDLGAHLFLTALPEDATRHRRVVEFLEHPSSIDLSLREGLVGRLFPSRNTGLVLGLGIWPGGSVPVSSTVGIVQYLGRLLLEGHGGFGFFAYSPDYQFVTLKAGAAFLAGAHWLPALSARYQWSRYTFGSSTGQSSNSLELTLSNRFFLTPKLALSVDLSGSGASPVAVPVGGWPDYATVLRTSLRFDARASVDWEWNHWISTAVSVRWTWTRAGEFPPWWWVGPGFDIRVRF